MGLFRRLVGSYSLLEQPPLTPGVRQARIRHGELIAIGDRLLEALNLESKLASYLRKYRSERDEDQTLQVQWEQCRSTIDRLILEYITALESYSTAISSSRSIEELADGSECRQPMVAGGSIQA